MEKRGYKKPMSTGPVIGSGGLAMIIPPSSMAVLLASLARISVGKLLVATPSESAAAGALGSIGLAAIYRKLNWDVMKKSLLDAIQTAIMVFMILTGSTA